MGTGSPDVLPRLPPRGVITKAGGAAGDAAAGVLDPAAPPLREGPFKTHLANFENQLDEYDIQTP